MLLGAMPANDELIIPIEKAFWPRGVMRGLNPELRALGERHGNIVIAAKPNVHIMVKGPKKDIDSAKESLRALLEEHFPDAPIPEELGGDAPMDEAEEVPEPVAPEPPAKPAAPSAQATGAAASVPSAAASVPAGVAIEASKKRDIAAMPVMALRRQPRCGLNAAPGLLWECTRKSSSFIRKPVRTLPRTWSAEPTNLVGIHSSKYSALANIQALDVRPVKTGAKEAIELIQSSAKSGSQQRPKARLTKMGLKKCPKKGLRQLDIELVGKNYRRDLVELARAADF